MAAKKSRSHLVLMRVTFDRPCSKSHAVAQAQDVINGTFYTTALEPHQPETMKVRGFASVTDKVKAALA